MTTTLPDTQKAWRAHRRGRPRDVLSLDDIPVPQPKPGQALVKVEAAALNPVGYKLMVLLPNFVAKRPCVAEHDFTGTVIEPNGTSFKAGDKVWGYLDASSGQGALAQYVTVTEEQAALRPNNLSLEQAAGLGCVGLTAQQAIFQDAGVEPGQSVLVVGGSGSLGGIAIQMLKQIGCKVYASCSGKNVEFVKSLGADVVYDYTASPLYAQISSNPPNPKFHAIIDCVGGYELFKHSEAYLAPGGKYVGPGTAVRGWHSIPGELWSALSALLKPAWLGGTRRKYIYTLAKVDKEKMAAVNQIVNNGSVVPAIDSVYEFSDVLNAYDKIMTDRAKGKIVIRVP